VAAAVVAATAVAVNRIVRVETQWPKGPESVPSAICLLPPGYYSSRRGKLWPCHAAGLNDSVGTVILPARCRPQRFLSKDEMSMARDIDYAAVAVKKAIVEKFWKTDLQDLEAVAGDKTIALRHQGRVAEGTRDDLLAAVRKATSFDNLWEVLANEGRCCG